MSKRSGVGVRRSPSEVFGEPLRGKVAKSSSEDLISVLEFWSALPETR